MVSSYWLVVKMGRFSSSGQSRTHQGSGGATNLSSAASRTISRAISDALRSVVVSLRPNSGNGSIESDRGSRDEALTEKNKVERKASDQVVSGGGTAKTSAIRGNESQVNQVAPPLMKVTRVVNVKMPETTGLKAGSKSIKSKIRTGSQTKSIDDSGTLEHQDKCVGRNVDHQEMGKSNLQMNRFFGSKRRLCSKNYVMQNRRKWLGPTRESNWVIPGRLLVGAYPFTWTAKKNKVVINKGDLLGIVNAGVSTFVCLQDEAKWSSQDAHEKEHPVLANKSAYKVVRLHEQPTGEKVVYPYIYDAAALLRERDQQQQASQVGSEKEKKQTNPLQFIHLPIVDLNCTSDGPVLELAYYLAKKLACDDSENLGGGPTIYIHCWGGHGRTGTLVAVMLGILYGINAEQALEWTQIFHDIRRCKLQVRSPQTDQQCEQVRRILKSPQALRAMKEFGERTLRVPTHCKFEKQVKCSGDDCSQDSMDHLQALRLKPTNEELLSQQFKSVVESAGQVEEEKDDDEDDDDNNVQQHMRYRETFCTEEKSESDFKVDAACMIDATENQCIDCHKPEFSISPQARANEQEEKMPDIYSAPEPQVDLEIEGCQHDLVERKEADEDEMGHFESGESKEQAPISQKQEQQQQEKEDQNLGHVAAINLEEDEAKQDDQDDEEEKQSTGIHFESKDRTEDESFDKVQMVPFKTFSSGGSQKSDNSDIVVPPFKMSLWRKGKEFLSRSSPIKLSSPSNAKAPSSLQENTSDKDKIQTVSQLQPRPISSPLQRILSKQDAPRVPQRPSGRRHESIIRQSPRERVVGLRETQMAGCVLG